MSENPYMQAVPKRDNPYMSAVPEKTSDNPYMKAVPEKGPISKTVEAVDNTASAIVDYVDETTQPAQDALIKSGSVVLDAMQILDRPRNAVATAAKNIYQGKSASAGLERGISGKEYTSTQQLLSDEYREENPVKSTVMGIAGDIATDPLTYTPASVITAPVKAVKGLAKAAGVTRIATKIADNGIFKAFNYYVGDAKKAKDLANRYRQLIGGTRYEIPSKAKAFNNEIKSIADELGVDVTDLKSALTDSVETNTFIGKFKADEVADRLVSRNREMLDIEQAYGVPVGDLGPTYMAHILSPDGKKAVDKADILDFLSLNPVRTHPSAQMRKLEGTVAEINNKGYYGAEKLFVDDPVVIMAVREMRHAQAVGGAKYIDDVTGKFGIKTAEAPSNYVPVKGMEGYSFDPEVAKAIEVGYGKITSPEEMSKLVRLYDGAQKWWKMWSLGARPAYHARNELGNLWNSYLGGMTNPDRLGQAAKLQMMMHRENIKGTIAGIDASTLYRNAVDHGIMGRGQYHADLGISVQQELGKVSKNPLTLKTDNPILQAGFKAGQQMETNARLALYIDRIKKGDSYEDAAKHVNKYLFDYDDLGAFEEQGMKRLFPFYVWTRKNIPLQLEAMYMSPDKMQKINIVRNNIEQDVEKPDPANVQDYVKESGPVYFGANEENDVKKVFTLMNYHPTMDIERLLNPKEMISGLTSPLIKAPLEYLFNYDTFRKKDIKEFEGQSVDWMGIRMPVRLAHLAKNLVMLNEIDRANPYNVFGKNTFDEEGNRVKSNSFWMEDELSYRVPDNAPVVGGEIFGIGTPREERTDLAGTDRLIQYLFGVRAYSVDDELGEIMRYMEFKRDAVELKKIIKRAYISEKPREAEEAFRALGIHFENEP